MSYNGTLIAFADGTKIPTKYMKAESYKSLYSITDLDSTRNANNELIRNTLEHRIPKIEWETPNMLTNTEVAEFFKMFSNRYSVPGERKVKLTMYIQEIDDYVTQDMYMSDPTLTIYSINGTTIKYNSFRVALIGY